MAVKASKIYEASDGKEFDTEQEAERYDELIKLRDAYEAAERQYLLCLAQSCKTADGEPFTFGWSGYYKIVGGYYNFPRVARIDIYRWDKMQVDTRHDGTIEIVFHSDREDGRERRQETHRLSELYTTERSAKEALLVRAEEWCQTQKTQLAELKKSLKY